MRKHARKSVVLALLATFVLSLAYTIAFAAPPCNRCRKEGCPDGHCYTDCVGCCYFDWRYGEVCFR